MGEIKSAISGVPGYQTMVNMLVNATVQDEAFTATLGEIVIVDTSGGAISVAPPTTQPDGSALQVGQGFGIIDMGAAGSNAITITTTTQKLFGAGANVSISTNKQGVILVWAGTTLGWVGHRLTAI